MVLDKNYFYISLKICGYTSQLEIPTFSNWDILLMLNREILDLREMKSFKFVNYKIFEIPNRKIFGIFKLKYFKFPNWNIQNLSTEIFEIFPPRSFTPAKRNIWHM